MGVMLESVLNWRLKTPFYYGWLVLGITAVATFAASGVSQVVIGGIQVYITDDTGWSERTISYAATAGTWGSGLLAPFIGRLADRYGPRWLMPSGLLAAGAGLFVLSGADALWQFYGAYILSRAIANPVLIGLVPGTAAVNFFRRRRNVALALVSTFRPISGAINIQIISLIAVHQGWRAAYRYLGILSLLLIIPVALFVRRRPEDIGLLPDGATAETADQGGGIGRQSVEDSWTAGETVRDRTFWLIVATGTVGVLASSSAGFSLVPYLVHEVGLSTPGGRRRPQPGHSALHRQLGVGLSGGLIHSPALSDSDNAGDGGDARLSVDRRVPAGGAGLRPHLGGFLWRGGDDGEHGAGPILRARLLRRYPWGPTPHFRRRPWGWVRRWPPPCWPSRAIIRSCTSP